MNSVKKERIKEKKSLLHGEILQNCSIHISSIAQVFMKMIYLIKKI